MRSRYLLPALVLGFGLAALALLPTTAAEPADAAKTDKLIKQMGSGDFEERVQAARDLDAFGVKALPQLRKAMKSDDVEVKRRAGDLVKKWEKKELSAKILAPKRVHLVYKDTPLKEAVADFNKKTGYRIAFSDPDNKLKDKKVTLDTGETTFWHAFELFCDKAGLKEYTYTDLMPDKPGGPPKMPDLVWLKLLGLGHLALVPGKAKKVATDDSSSIRVRAADTLASVPPFIRGPVGLIHIDLPVAPEPRIRWQSAESVKVLEAIDDKGQKLTAFTGPAYAGVFDEAVRISLPGGGANAVTPMIGPNRMYTVFVRLKKGDKVSKELKVLKGTITAWVLSEPETVIHVTDLARAKGKTFKGGEGYIKVTDVTKGKDGLDVRFELLEPSSYVPEGGLLITLPTGRAGLRAPLHRQLARLRQFPPSGLSLVDAKGNELPAVLRIRGGHAKDGRRVTEYQMVYRPQKDRGEPAGLVFRGSRSLTIDVPFNLKNVKLTDGKAPAATTPVIK